MELKNKYLSLTVFSFAGILSMSSVEGEQEKDDRNKQHMNIGTIGHVDHGKTIRTAEIIDVLKRIDEKFGRPGVYHEEGFTIVKTSDPREDVLIDRKKRTVTFFDAGYAFEMISKLPGLENYLTTIRVKEDVNAPALNAWIKAQRPQKTKEGYFVFENLEFQHALRLLGGYAPQAQTPEQWAKRRMMITVDAGTRFQYPQIYEHIQGKPEPEDFVLYVLGRRNNDVLVDAPAYDFKK